MIFAILLLLLLNYIFCKLSSGKTQSPTCLVGKTALVTGGNSGIGFQVCLNLASRGCKIIIADRNDSEESRRKIIEETQNPNVISKTFDLASFDSVRKFSKELKTSEEKIDLLINNPGIANRDAVTEDGLNEVMQVNHFGHFLLTHLLLDLLKKSTGGARVIFTSSLLAFLSNLNVENFTSVSTSETNRFHYCDSKLSMIVASDVFARKLKLYGITCNSVHVGLVRTTLYRQMRHPVYEFLYNINQKIFGKSVWEGAQTTTHLAVAKELQNVTGKYFGDCVEFYKPLQAYNERFVTKVWEMSQEHVKLLPNEKI